MSESNHPPQMFRADFVKVTHHNQRKHQTTITSKNRSNIKLWITGSLLCFATCIIFISAIIWYTVSEPKNSKLMLKDSDDSVDSIYKNSLSEYNDINFEEKTEYIENDIVQEIQVDNTGNSTFVNITVKMGDGNDLKTLENVNIESKEDIKNEDLDIGNDFNLKTLFIDALGSLSNVALGTKRQTIKDDVSKEVHKIQSNTETITVRNDNQNMGISKLSINFTQNDVMKGGSKSLDSSVLNYLNGIISMNERIQDITLDNTQISSPDHSGQVTTNLVDLLNDDTIPYSVNKTLNATVNENINKTEDFLFDSSAVFAIQGFISMIKHNLLKSDDNYFDQDYFYSDKDAPNFYYDFERSSWMNYLLEKIQELYDWIITDIEMGGNGNFTKENQYALLPEILRALNYSVIQNDVSILITKLKDLYYTHNDTEFDMHKSKKILENTSSVLSFGLLILDVLLLRNIQLIAWDNQNIANKEILNDPEIFAFNALFMDPNKTKRVYEFLQRSKARRLLMDLPSGYDVYESLYKEDLTSGFYKNTNFKEELVNFVSSTMRAMNNLGNAFRNTRNKLVYDMENDSSIRNNLKKSSNMVSDSFDIDCIWTVYCKNLDKATKMEGIYGFLAKLNKIGLRLLLGEISADQAIEAIFIDRSSESKYSYCDRLFPKCNGKNVSKIIIDEIISKVPKKK